MIQSSPMIDPIPDPSLLKLLQTLPSPLQLAFLQQLFEVEAPYPWLAETPEALQYFESIDTAIAAADPTLQLDEPTADPEFAAAWQSLSAKLEASWTEPATASASQALYTQLSTEFAATVPAEVLRTLAQAVQQIYQTPQSLADQLVTCVQSILPQWSIDDLQVMARPFAYSMRSTSVTDTMAVALHSMQSATWTELAEIEQVRVSLAIARYALAQADALPTEAGTVD